MKKFILEIKNTIKHFGLLSLVILPIFALINTFFIIGVKIQTDAINARLFASAQSELAHVELFMNSGFYGLYDDMDIIKNASELQAYIADPSTAHFNEYVALLERIMQTKEIFVNTKVIEPNGDVIYEIIRNEDQSLTLLDTGLGHVSLEPYFPIIAQADEEELFISNMYLKETVPTVTLAKKFIYENAIVSYLSIDINASGLLSIINDYADNQTTHLSYGLITQHELWTFDENQTLVIDQNTSHVNQVLDDIANDPYTMGLHFDFDDPSYPFVSTADQGLMIYVVMDYDAAVSASPYLLLNSSWIIILINVLWFILVAWFAYVLKTKNDDQLLTKANLYLTEHNKDAVVVTDYKGHIIYTNQAFLNNYGFYEADIKQKDIHQLIGVPSLIPPFHEAIDHDYESFNWSKTQSDIYILKHLRIKTEKVTRKTHRRFIYVYSEPKIDLDYYQKYLNKKESTLIAFKDILKLQPFHINQTMVAMIRFEDADAYTLAHYIKMRVNHIDFIAQVQYNYILIYSNLSENAFHALQEKIDFLLERYRYLPHVARDFSYVYVTASASKSIDNLNDLLDGLLVTLEIARSNSQYKHLVYHEEMRKKLEREKLIRNEIGYGFTNDEFHLLYQPQKDLHTNRIIGVEALLRWDNQTLNPIYPDEFIPIIENSYYINQLSMMVLKKVIHDFEPYVDLLPKDFRISINITAFDINDMNIIEKLIQIIENSKLDFHHFIFEMTESHYIDNIEKTNHIVDLLHEKNIMLAIDDFGTGYSSINSLKSIHVDLIKLDRSFIKDYPNEDSKDMLETIIGLIHGLHKKVVVEGVETKEQEAFCIKSACNYMQGFYISKPINVKTIMNRYFKNKG